MKLYNEQKETVYKYKIDCTPEEADQLKKIAVERFSKDEEAQLEYAIVSILEEMVEKMDDKPKRSKNGNKSNRRK